MREGGKPIDGRLDRATRCQRVPGHQDHRHLHAEGKEGPEPTVTPPGLHEGLEECVLFRPVGEGSRKTDGQDGREQGETDRQHEGIGNPTADGAIDEESKISHKSAHAGRIREPLRAVWVSSVNMSTARESREQIGSFASLPLDAVVKRGLDAMGYTTPTPIQWKAIGPLIDGRDLIGLAPTGTGKTLAYGIPMVQRLLKEPPPINRRAPKRGGKGDAGGKFVDPRRRLRTLVVVPTRELASQVANEVRTLSKGSLIKVGAVWGKAALKPQRERIEAGLDILVGTPGRLRELMDLDVLSLAYIRHLVIDEGDRMLDMGFLPQIRRILERMPDERQMAFFSATMPPAIEDLARAFLDEPLRIEIGTHTRAAEHLGHRLLEIEDPLKVPLVLGLVVDEQRRGVILFTRTRRRAGWVAAALRRQGISVGLVHGDRSQNQRLRALEQFANSELAVIVATDVAARGLHIPAIQTVINYDLPLAAEEWVHRVGRAGHGGGFGESITLVSPSEEERWRKIASATGTKLFPESLPAFEQWVRPQDIARVERLRSAEKAERKEPFRTSGASSANTSTDRSKGTGSRGGKAASRAGTRGGDRIGHGRRNAASRPIKKGQKPGSGVRKPK